MCPLGGANKLLKKQIELRRREGRKKKEKAKTRNKKIKYVHGPNGLMAS